MEFRIVRWYDERKTVTQVHSFEEAYTEYNRALNCDTIQVFVAIEASKTPFLLAQKEC